VVVGVALVGLFAFGVSQAVGPDTAAHRSEHNGVRHAGQQPNIVVIQADDATLRQFTRKVMPRTTRLLADRGTSFERYIATTPQCCPSRASLFSGQYAHNNGVTSNVAGYQALTDKANVLPVWLQRAGYRTMHVGKFMNGYKSADVPPGWSQWRTVIKPGTHYYDYHYSINGRLEHRGYRRSDHITRVLGRDATRLVESHARQRRPFYLQLDERAPHTAVQDNPHGRCDRAPIPDPRDETRFGGQRPDKRPSFNEARLADKPRFLRAARPLAAGGRHKLGNVLKLRKGWRCALAALAGVDRNIASVYRAVRRAGELSRTVFIFTSDNGLFFGEHRIGSGNALPYEETLHLPLVIRVPERYRHGASQVPTVSAVVGNIDLAPTILDLARASPCAAPGHCRTMDGRSLMPLLTGRRDWPGHRGLLSEYLEPRARRYAVCEFTGIRTRDTIYVRYSGAVDDRRRHCRSTDQRERYNLKADPFELDNLCFGGNPAHCPQGVRQEELEERLGRLEDCAGIAGRDRRVDGRPFCE
jgi:arylsulfatase A-like enzyme